MRVYLDLRELPAHCQPCLVTRAHGLTHVSIHRGTTWGEILAWSTVALTLEERGLYRLALGVGPVGTPITDEQWESAPQWVPDALLTLAERRRQFRRMELDLTG